MGKENVLPDVYKKWATLKNKPIINKNQLFDWMKHLTDDEIDEWKSKVKGNYLTAMVDTNILYEISKLSDK
jgi:hypothetical protein